MQGYTPVFGSVYAGTLCGKWPTAAVWVSLLPLCDKRGHIDMSHAAISALTGWPLDLLRQGIGELMKPDPASRSPDEDGRRLILLDPDHRDWGWRVVNHGLYREKARKLQYDTERTASGRDASRKKESREVPRSPDAPSEVPLSDADADSKGERVENATAPPRAPSRKTNGKKPKTALPDGFALDGELREYAEKHLPQVDVAGLFEGFCGKARAKAWVYADWRQAWQEFCRNCAPNSGHWAQGQYPKTGANGVRWQ